MKLTNKRIVLIVLLCIFILPITFYKLQNTKVFWIKNKENSIGKECLDIFIVQNPPSKKEDIVKFIEHMNDTLKIKNKRLYIQSFYKETFNLTRFYKPYYSSFIGNYVNIREDNAEFTKEHFADYIFEDENSNKNCGDWCPILPYYRIYEEGILEYEYYPRGLKNNSKLRWKNFNSTNSITKIGDTEYKN